MSQAALLKCDSQTTGVEFERHECLKIYLNFGQNFSLKDEKITKILNKMWRYNSFDVMSKDIYVLCWKDIYWS